MHSMRRMITKTREEIGRKKIGTLLSLMGFHDDDPDATARIMRERLRQIEEQTKKRSTIKKINFKFGGKTVFKVPLQTPTMGDDDDMQIDSSNHSSKDMINNNNNVIEVDQGIEEKNNSGNEDGVMETNLSSENPNCDTDIKEFIKSIGGSKVELVIEKKLTKSDCDKNQGRLLIPELQVMSRGFLGIDEKRKLEMRECISVEMFDPERRKIMLNLGQWKMKHENYVLKTNWNKLVFMNGLRENMVVRLLSFRVDQKLCFAVVRV
ncbi:hypothetical protein QVD17_39806 [Tagetes erecta]|uniref:B3 domain-containing protein n=1 Tax=Tagetes erecta TaxID=13708 RepID=A0AAD8JR55_TARER|nr:hypothetical protein QVD17_39806 [Tagetes erecta]